MVDQFINKAQSESDTNSVNGDSGEALFEPAMVLVASGSWKSPDRVPEDGIAIVGIAFRFPGDISDEQVLWNALKEGYDLVDSVPADRWAVDELQHSKRSEPGRSITFSAGVLSRIDEFDAAFFSISPREAAWLDPQQRLLLELAWEAMENGGQVPSSLAGTDCAVYVGISSLDYGTRGLDDLASMTAHSMTGNTLSIAANRLSYVFDLRGPSLAVDTACSSSLVALHQACNSLRAGEASIALVGGVNLLLHPYPFVGFTKASMLSAEGRCRAFDAAGDGYVRAEGGVVLLLKPLARAIADEDDIQAVIRATGTNADGARKTGITIPSRDGQAELMRMVLSRSGLSPLEVDYIEAHGTGTAVGDPVEASAIGSVYGSCRPPDRPLPIGSIKTNLGHLEPASGMAGLVKAVMVLKNRALPPMPHLASPNPHIDFSGLNLEPVTRYSELVKAGDELLVAGVNSFGFGGANAHVLLQEFRPRDVKPCPGLTRLPPLFLSARTNDALRTMAGNYAALLRGKTAENFYDIAYAAAFRRDFLDKRLVLSVANPADAAELLARYASGEATARIIVEDGLTRSGAVAFVYSGNGSQWVGMGWKLLAESARFAELLAEINAILEPLAGFSVIEELRAGEAESRIDDTTVAQPLLFAIQVAITTLLREQGLEPAAVTGHSVGEVAAAWAAGTLDLNQAARVICARSAAQGLTRGTGRMASVSLSEPAMAKTLAELGGDLDVEIAGINSPGNVTLSGCLAGLERIRAYVEPEGVFFRLLDLDYAFHSRHMDAIENRIGGSLADLSPSSSTNPIFVSTVAGDVLDGTALGADYWWRNVRQPVRFAEAVGKLIDLGCRILVEIGPHAILQRYMGECLAAAGGGRALATLRRNDDGVARIEDVILRVHLLSDGRRLESYFPYAGRHVRLPNYPWQRERHWHPRTSEGHALIERRRVHPLLGWRLSEAEWAWENTLDPLVLPWLSDHRVGGAVVFPGSAFAEMALAAVREWQGGRQQAFEELDILSPLVFDGEHARTTRFNLNPRDGGFQILSRQRLSSDDWTLHAAGRLVEASIRNPAKRIEPVAAGNRRIEQEAHYRLTAMLGLDYGPHFRGLAHARVDQDRLEAVFDLPADVRCDDGYLLHPAVLDVCYQSLADLFQADIEAGRGAALLPVQLGRLNLLRDAKAVGFRARLRLRGARSVLADFELLDDGGELVASVLDCRFRAAPLLHHRRSQAVCWESVPWLQPHPSEGCKTVLPPTLELIKSLRPAFDRGEAEFKRHAWFKETLPLLEALALSFALEAFRTLFERRPDWLQAALHDTAPLPYLGWLAACLRQESILVERDGTWCLESGDEVPSPEEIWRALLRDAPACLPQLALLARVGVHLPDLLTGEMEGAAFIETLRRFPAAETLHDDDPAYLGTRLAAETVLSGLAGTWPAHRRLRVLEVPAGGSRIPRRLVGMLAEDRLDYVLAPADEETRLRLQTEYQEVASVDVAELDAGWKLTSGKTLPDAFDVVLLRHVLHTAASPHAVLMQAKRWLAPGGLLLVAERCPDWSADIIEGLDPAWWRLDAAGQPLSSLLGPPAWLNALRAEGFDEIELFSEPAAEGLSEGGYLLLAKRPTQETVAMSAPGEASWLLIVDDVSAGLAGHVRRHLESMGQRVVMAPQPETADPGGFDHVVHMLGWSAPVDSLDCPVLLHKLVRAAAGCDRPPRLWLITRGGALLSDNPAASQPHPVQAALWGYGRVVMNEYPPLSCTMIDMACDPDSASTPARLENELLYPDGNNEIVLAPMARYSLRLREEGPAAERQGDAHDDARYRLDFRVPGQLRNLAWMPNPARPLQDHEIEVRTHAAGLNFRDVMYLMGLLPDEAVENGFAGASLGLEFAGVVTRIGSRVRNFAPGDAVLGFGASCFASHIVTRADALAPMPVGWTFDAAATVPTVFFTVYYALKHLADLQPGERVLIHGAAGGVGIAAIQLARHLGAEIFATAGSDEKRDFVRLLGADRVFDSRSLEFADEILAATGGQGVDVVLNSLAGEAVRRNLRVLRPFGRFLELGKRDFFENTPVGLRPFKDNISYYGIDADQLLTGRPALATKLFREMMALFHEGVFSPLPYRLFSCDRVVEAFRTMQQARHIGKVVVSLAEVPAHIECESPQGPAESLRFAKDSTWLVTGGLSGFGLATARWLAARGVGTLVLLGRRGAGTPGAAQAIEELRSQGVDVRAAACDITDSCALAAVILDIQKSMPPLKGILHAAAVIDDALIANLDAERIDCVLRPKLLGAWNLHALTLDIPVEHFVLYSSVTTLIGNPGQANYVAANAGLEALAGLRRKMGLPATCIGWGPIGDAGYLARNEGVKDSLANKLGRVPLAAEEALAFLDRLLSDERGHRAVANFEWSTLSRMLPSAPSARFELLNRNLKAGVEIEDSADFRALIAGKGRDQVADIVGSLVIQEVAGILCISPDRIEPSRSLHELGMDSLMAVELALGLERRFGIQLPVMMLNESPTAERVTARIVQRLMGEDEAGVAAVRSDGSLVENLAMKHGESITRDEIDRTLEDARALAQSGTRLIA